MADEKDQHSEEDQKSEELKKKRLEDLKRKAFYSVLLAFIAEIWTIGNKRTPLVEKLMKELNISQETRISFEDNIQKNLIAEQERVISEAKKSLKPPLVPTCAATSSSSWGRVDPEALVGRRISLRMSCEDEFEDLLIKHYNAKDAMHGLENVDTYVMEMSEELSWVDFREVPPDDIIWKDGEAPEF